MDSRIHEIQTPAPNLDQCAQEESWERIEHHLENMIHEACDTNSTRLWLPDSCFPNDVLILSQHSCRALQSKW